MRTTAKQSQRKSNKGGEIQSPMSNVAELHGDTQQSTILTGQMPGKEDRMSDYGQGLAAGNVASCGNDNAEHQEFGEMVLRLMEYLLAGVWRNFSISLVFFGTTYLIVLHRRVVICQKCANSIASVSVETIGTSERTGQKSRRIPYAGEPGSEMVFVNASEVPDKDPKKWLQAQLKEHLAVTSDRLLMFIPMPLMDALLTEDSPEHHRWAALRDWKKFQNEHWNLCEMSQHELQEFIALTGFASKETRSGEYVDHYTLVLKSIATAALVQTDMPCIEICSRIRKGQLESAENPDDYTGNAVFDGIHAGRYLDMTLEDIEKAEARSPKIFTYIGWDSDSVPDED